MKMKNRKRERWRERDCLREKENCGEGAYQSRGEKKTEDKFHSL